MFRFCLSRSIFSLSLFSLSLSVFSLSLSLPLSLSSRLYSFPCTVHYELYIVCCKLYTVLWAGRTPSSGWTGEPQIQQINGRLFGYQTDFVLFSNPVLRTTQTQFVHVIGCGFCNANIRKVQPWFCLSIEFDCKLGFVMTTRRLADFALLV